MKRVQFLSIAAGLFFSANLYGLDYCQNFFESNGRMENLYPLETFPDVQDSELRLKFGFSRVSFDEENLIFEHPDHNGTIIRDSFKGYHGWDRLQEMMLYRGRKTTLPRSKNQSEDWGVESSLVEKLYRNREKPRIYEYALAADEVQFRYQWTEEGYLILSRITTPNLFLTVVASRKKIILNLQYKRRGDPWLRHETSSDRQANFHIEVPIPKDLKFVAYSIEENPDLSGGNYILKFQDSDGLTKYMKIPFPYHD